MLRLRQIKLSYKTDTLDNLYEKICKKLKLTKDKLLDVKIIKKSIDARDKNNILYVYEVDILLKNEKEVLKKYKSTDLFVAPIEKYNFVSFGNKELPSRPVIIGSGPAGLFCAYLLAEQGYRPLIIERGEKIEERIKSVEKFWKSNILNENSNIQFGEGGAGTFSDGKLNTLVKDKFNRGKKVFEIFVENGAPKEILYINKPHIGTDILRKVIINMRNKIISLKGEFLYNTTLTDLDIKDNKLCGIKLNNKDYLKCDNLILAIGHSARDTFYMLRKHNISMEAKAFAVGLRIEHPQEIINTSQYGISTNILPPASYKLTYTTKANRGVYSFCMCPGGYVINASSEKKALVINGMSNHQRDSKKANSAIVVTVNKNDFGTDIFSGLEWQRNIERTAYKLANGLVPIQKYSDFLQNVPTTSLASLKPKLKGNYTLANLNNYLPDFIIASIKEAMPHFATKIKHFDNPDTLLYGVETRTSSPIRIIRDNQGVASVLGIYPCGEGAGYAGGITTAAIDGIKTAENIAKKYKPYPKND